MASKNTKKVLRKIYSQNKNFKPQNNSVSWNNAVDYIKAKDKRLSYNSIFVPIFEEVKKELRAEGCHESVLKSRAKKKTKEIVKAHFAAKFAAEQSSAGQEEVQPQGEGTN